jgi:hypothetical protein
MRLPFQSQQKSLTDRAQAAAGDAVEFARSIPQRLEGGRERALAVAGAAASVAAGLAFWRSRKDQGPSVHHDPAQTRTPWKTPPPSNGSDGERQTPQVAGTKPVTSVKEAAENAAGSRSK